MATAVTCPFASASPQGQSEKWRRKASDSRGSRRVLIAHTAGRADSAAFGCCWRARGGGAGADHGGRRRACQGQSSEWGLGSFPLPFRRCRPPPPLPAASSIRVPTPSTDPCHPRPPFPATPPPRHPPPTQLESAATSWWWIGSLRWGPRSTKGCQCALSHSHHSRDSFHSLALSPPSVSRVHFP